MTSLLRRGNRERRMIHWWKAHLSARLLRVHGTRGSLVSFRGTWLVHLWTWDFVVMMDLWMDGWTYGYVWWMDGLCQLYVDMCHLWTYVMYLWTLCGFVDGWMMDLWIYVDFCDICDGYVRICDIYVIYEYICECMWSVNIYVICECICIDKMKEKKKKKNSIDLPSAMTMALGKDRHFSECQGHSTRQRAFAECQSDNTQQRRSFCRVSEWRHSATEEPLPSVRDPTLDKGGGFAECQKQRHWAMEESFPRVRTGDTRQRIRLCRVSAVWHSAKPDIFAECHPLNCTGKVFGALRPCLSP